MSPHIVISEHSPSLGIVHMEIRNPDTRDSLRVEADDRRFFDRQLNIRIDKLILELGRVQDFLSLVAEQQNELSRDLAKERADRLSADMSLHLELTFARHALTDHMAEMKLTLESIDTRMAELALRSWWSMLKDSFRRLFYHEKEN